MRARRLAAAVSALLLARAARAETVVRTIGPLKLEGRSKAMEGPQADQSFRFPHSGFVTAHSVRILDAAGGVHTDDGIHCHSIFFRDDDRGDSSGAGGLRERGLLSEPSRLGLSENQNEIAFPAGFGVFVDTASSYDIGGQLVDVDGTRNGTYTMEYRFELAPASPPLKALTGYLVKMQSAMDAEGHACGPNNTFFVPPGRHSYQKEFSFPRAVRLHYVSTHVHRHAVLIELVDAASGKALVSAPVRFAPDGSLTDSPVYSSAEGLVLKKDAKYLFRLTYDNPLAEPIDAMGNMRLFVAEER
jgi:hypothetical protein